MTTALGYVMGSFRGAGETLTHETVALAQAEYDVLTTIESAARLWINRPSPKSRELLKQALGLLPAEVGA